MKYKLTQSCSKQLCDRVHDNYVFKNQLRQAKSISGFQVYEILHSIYINHPSK